MVDERYMKVYSRCLIFLNPVLPTVSVKCHLIQPENNKIFKKLQGSLNENIGKKELTNFISQYCILYRNYKTATYMYVQIFLSQS